MKYFYLIGWSVVVVMLVLSVVVAAVTPANPLSPVLTTRGEVVVGRLAGWAMFLMFVLVVVGVADWIFL